MDDDQIKVLRHSFTNPHREDFPKPKVNKFGHTVLGDEMEMADQEIDLKINEFGDVSAEPKQSLFDSPEFQKWAEKQPILKTPEPEEPVEEVQISEKSSIVPNSVDIAALISELDEMDGTTERKQIENQWLKNCLNQDCMYNLPKEAKFCLKCGTPQMPKFCTECGYSFPGMEKFCPDCGNKR
jgi:RNA polymerase subunit RPABC4/transcription elongation factor Spt4